MSRRAALTALPAALLLLTACSSGATEPAVGLSAEPAPGSSAPVDTPSAAPTTAAPTTTAPAAPSEPAGPVTFEVTVAGGEIVGGLQTVEVPVGEPFRVTVTSDVADEIHLHGYDVYADVAAGGTATVESVASIPGVVVVELEEAGLTVLRVASR